MLKFKHNKRFSTYLMTAFVVLVSVSVVIILATLYRYFGKKVEAEFYEKLRAQKGQVEIILNNRMAGIQSALNELRSDNIIRVTVMLDDTSKLEDRITQFYPPINGVYHFVKKVGEKQILPEKYPGMTEEIVNYAMTEYPRGKIVQDQGKIRLLWLFSAPVMNETGRMGNAYALYDMIQDQKLIEAIQLAGGISLMAVYSDQAFNLISHRSFELDSQIRKKIADHPGFQPYGNNQTLSKISGFQHLYFQSSLQSLIQEKQKVTVWMGLFAVVVLAVSTLMAVFLARKMVAPLRKMTAKAIQISEGQKDFLFETHRRNYWEFNQLSEAFNYMLTNLKNAEEQTRYRELLEKVDDAVYIVDLAGDIMEANEAAYSQLGYSLEEFVNLNLNQIIPENHVSLILYELVEKAQVQTLPKLNLATVHLKKNGSRLPVEIHSQAITYRGKKVILNVARNVSKRIEAQKALRESEERYRSVVENSSDGIVILSKDFKILYANEVFAEIIGCPRSKIEGHAIKKYLEPSGYIEVETYFQAIQKGVSANSVPICKLLRNGSEERSVMITANRFRDSTEKEKIVSQISDITDQLQAEKEKQHLEAQLMHAQKMEAIGTLAGGIAHDFNNILMGIQGYLSLMRLGRESDKPDNDSVNKYIQGIEENVMSAANLTEQLLGFARKGKYTLRPTNLNNVIEKSTRMFMRTKKEITLHKRCSAEIWNVEVDQGQIEQVLINLYLNAWHAMPDGGDLYIQTENVVLSDAYCEPFEVNGGNYVKLSVTDSGIGMDKETIERIFEPFFTTKEIGKGTGLGLASAYGIIKNHNGIIRVYSEQGHGTTFVIYLPSSHVEETDDSKTDFTLLRGSERVLLVDDEEGPIEVEKLMLQELGYSVITAENGMEAVDIYAQNPAKVDLVALDMIMPEMSGKATFEELKKINPAVKVLLVSGYSTNKQTEELFELGCKGFIQKPFDIIELSHKLRELLEN
ncbi:MAG: PAS domain S-box protein [Desulfobacterales bacterium]|jgi:PAS domain S-box-containing protein